MTIVILVDALGETAAAYDPRAVVFRSSVSFTLACGTDMKNSGALTIYYQICR